MKKQKNALIVVSIIFVLLLGLLFLLISMPAPEKNASLDISSVAFENIVKVTDDRKIVNVAVKNQNGDYEIKVESMDGSQVYAVDGLDEGKTSQSKAEMLYDSLINLKPTQKIDDSKDLSAYGLDAPSAEVTVTFSNNEKTTMLLGNDAPLGKGAYIRVEGDENVYLIDTADKEIFLNEQGFYQKNEEPANSPTNQPQTNYIEKLINNQQ